MEEEYDALLHNQLWTLVKRKADSSSKLNKACLVAKEFNQQAELEYDDTFSLIVKPGSIRTILALAVSQNWPLQQGS